MQANSTRVTHPLLRYAQAAESLQDRDAVLRGFSDSLGEYGFDFVFYRSQCANDLRPRLWSNIDLQRDPDPNHAIDPFFKYCCATYEVTYTGGDFLSYYPYLKTEEFDFFKPAADIGFRSGLAVPVAIGTEGRLAGFNLGSTMPKDDFLARMETLRSPVNLACLVVDRALERLARPARDMIGPDEQSAEPLTNTLTERERDMLFLLSQGYSRKEMASISKLSPNTIASYVKNLYAKLGVSNRSEATRHAMTLGLRPPRFD